MGKNIGKPSENPRTYIEVTLWFHQPNWKIPEVFSSWRFLGKPVRTSCYFDSLTMVDQTKKGYLLKVSPSHRLPGVFAHALCSPQTKSAPFSPLGKVKKHVEGRKEERIEIRKNHEKPRHVEITYRAAAN